MKIKKTKLKDYQSICSLCGEVYDRQDDSKEIAESGEYICPQCWNEEE